MKKTLFLLIINLFLFSCSKQSIDNSIDDDTGFNEILDNIPSIYADEKSVVFVNENRDEYIVKISYDDSVSYGTRRLNINGIDKTVNLNKALFSIVANKNTDLDGNLRKGILLFLNSGSGNSQSTFLSLTIENGKPIEVFPGHPVNREKITLINREFDDVYIGSRNDGVDESYNSIYYNTTIGVVGFQDNWGELWEFDRFE